MKKSFLLAGAAAVAFGSAAHAQNTCASGKTLTDGVLTIATGNPAYYPWVMDDAPESKQGFEAAIAYAVANEMGFADDQVTWVRSSFDQAIQPGAKDFDFNLQQYSITPEREEVVDFSLPYYSAPAAVLIKAETEDAAIISLKNLQWGAAAATTAPQMIADLVGPSKDLLLYDDSADVVEAMKANQIDAALFDLPTALYLGAVVLDNGLVFGQFAAAQTANPDQFGLLMEDGNPLKECVDAAISALGESGELAAIEAEWLQDATGVMLLK